MNEQSFADLRAFLRHAEIVELVSALVTDRVLSKLVEAFLNAVGLRCDDVAGTIL